MEAMLFHWYRYCGRVPTCTTDGDAVNELLYCNTFVMLHSMASFLLRIFLIAISVTRWFRAILMTLKSSVKARLLCQKCTTRIHPSMLFNCKNGSQFCFATFYTGCRLWQARQRLLWNLHQMPADVTIETNLTRGNNVLNGIKKRELQHPDFTPLLEAELKKNV